MGALLEPGTGGVETVVVATGVVFALYLVRVWGVAPFATVLALGAGIAAPGVFALRLLSDLLIAALLFWAVGRWSRAHDGRHARGAPGRLDRWLERVRAGLGRGSLFGNTLIAGYLINTYVVFAMIPTLRTGRRRALAGAVTGELAGFVIDLLAILGLTALFGGSQAAVMAGVTVVALALTGVNYLLQARLHPAAATA